MCPNHLSQKSIFIGELREENGSISGQIMKCTIFLSMCSSMGMQSWFSQEVFGSSAAVLRRNLMISGAK